MHKLLTVLLLATPLSLAATTPRVAPEPGQAFDQNTAGTLFSGRARGGLDFNVWFDPSGMKPARMVFDKTSLPKTNLALGAAFGRSNTVFVLVQRALTRDRTDQEVYAIDRVYGGRRLMFRTSDHGLLLALGERFEYDEARDQLVFTAMKTERVSSGKFEQRQHVYQWGPMGSRTPRLKKMW
jgi:hypothetical protein